jgi:hypothetical protein
MIVYFLPSVSGLTRWVDYIPVKFTTVATAATENTYNQNGYIPVVSLSSIAGATPFKEYVPVFLDSSAADADVWDVTITGFIPVGTAGIGGAALYLDFAATTSLDRRITFSRTTNATVTGSNGLIQNAPMNLLTFSEQFDASAWQKQNVTVAANATAAPDGTLTADTLTSSAANGFVNQVFSAAVATYTFSVWIKSVTVGTTLELNLYTGGGLSSVGAAVVTTTGSWQRVSVTGTFASASATAWAAIGGNASFSTGETIYVWGAQLELGSTATTYNPTTVKNLLGFTENFDNAAWTKSNASISATKVDDIYGQPFAQKLVENTANTSHQVVQTLTISAGTYTASIYAKAGERTRFGFSSINGRFPAASFDLVTLTATTIGATSAATITDVGGGWYRCTATRTVTAGAEDAQIRLIDAAGNTSYTGDGTSGIYIFGSQLSDSASVDPYVYNPVAAPTSTAYYGPRFDYDPVTLAPKGLLIEEQRTNLLTYSEQFDNAAWTRGASSSITANATISPDGVSTADFLVESTTTDRHRIFSPSYSATVSSYTNSIFVKAGTRTKVSLSFGNPVTLRSEFDLTTGVIIQNVGSIAGSIISVGNGWYRIAAVTTLTVSTQYLQIDILDSSGNLSYTGDGTSGLYIWGAQTELGAFATSYIPTVASQVTRAADSASMIGNNFARWYTQGVGTVFSQFDTPASGNRPVVSLDDNTANNMIRLRTEATDPYFRVVTGGSAQADLDVGTVASNTTYKMAGGFGSNSFLSCINAGTVGSDTSGTVPTVDRLRIGSDQAGAYLNGHIARTSYYSRVLTAAEDQGITA